MRLLGGQGRLWPLSSFVQGLWWARGVDGGVIGREGRELATSPSLPLVLLCLAHPSPFLCSLPSWILLMSLRPQLLRRPQIPGGAQHPWPLPSPRPLPPRILGGDPLSLQLLILGVVRLLHQPLGTPGGLLPLRGPQLTHGVGPRSPQLERGPHLTRGGAQTVSASPMSQVQSWACPGAEEKGSEKAAWGVLRRALGEAPPGWIVTLMRWEGLGLGVEG